jgi:hypothetical protein
MSSVLWKEVERCLDRNWNEQSGYTAPHHSGYPGYRADGYWRGVRLAPPHSISDV